MEAKIKLYNVFSDEKSPYHTTIEELYLYSILNGIGNQDGTWTNIDCIEQSYLQTGIKFSKRSKEAKPKINKLLNQLKTKHIIDYENKNMENSDLLIINFINDFGNSGYEIIPIDKFYTIHDMTDWYIYFTVKRFDKLKDKINHELGFHCSYDRWAKILGCTRKTAIKKIDHALDQKIIYINIGNYDSTYTKQDINTYRTTPFTEEEKTIQTKKKEDKKQQKIDESIQPFDTGNWYVKKQNGKYADLEPEDIILYRDAQSLNDASQQEFVKYCEKRERNICKSEQGKFMWDQLCYQAKEIERKRQYKNDQIVLNNAKYAVKYTFDGDVVEVTPDNINEINWKCIELFYYSNQDGKLNASSSWSFLSCQLVDMKTKKYIEEPEAVAYGKKLYQEKVINGELIDHNVAQSIINETTEHFYPSLKETTEYPLNDYDSEYIDKNSTVKNNDDELNELLADLEKSEEDESKSWSRQFCEQMIKQYDDDLENDANDSNVDELTHEANRKQIEIMKEPYIKRIEKIKQDEDVKKQQARKIADSLELDADKIFG